MTFKKRLEAFRGRFFGTVSGLLRPRLWIRVLNYVVMGITLWLTKLAIYGLLSYVGFTIPFI